MTSAPLPHASPGPGASVVFGDAVAAGAARHLALAPAASMQELADAAGVSRATLFRRFPSRAALVAELCRSAASAYVRVVEDADLERGTAREALARVVAALGELTPVVGLLGLQPLDELVEASLLAQTSATEDMVRRLVRRGQEAGEFRVDIDPEWVLAMMTWLVVASADAIRLGRLTPDAAQRHLAATVDLSMVRPPPE